jgi:predicted RNase H-like nuclease (RuvC/YqgF family)
MDIDDYINSLIKDNENLKNTVESLKKEIRMQRKEITDLREERRIFVDKDKGLNNITWKENNNND